MHGRHIAVVQFKIHLPKEYFNRNKFFRENCFLHVLYPSVSVLDQNAELHIPLTSVKDIYFSNMNDIMTFIL